MADRTVLRIEQIRRDGATQPRASIDFETVFDYMDAMVDGAEFPPVTIFYDGTSYWLADGFHRVKAAEQADFEEISCEVYQGTQQDAQWYSFAANKTNGLRRTNDDKQRAVRAALGHPNGAGLSDRQVASHVGVDHKTVSAWREKLEGTGEIPQSDHRTGRDGRTTNIDGLRQRSTTKSRTPQVATAGRAVCTTCGQEFSAPVWHCPGCDHHWPPAQSQCANCHQGRPTAPADVAEQVATGENEHGRQEQFERVYRAALEIETCGLTPKGLAAVIRRSNRSGQITEQLEKTNEFIAAVLAEAVVD